MFRPGKEGSPQAVNHFVHPSFRFFGKVDWWDQLRKGRCVKSETHQSSLPLRDDIQSEIGKYRAGVAGKVQLVCHLLSMQSRGCCFPRVKGSVRILQEQKMFVCLFAHKVDVSHFSPLLCRPFSAAHRVYARELISLLEDRTLLWWLSYYVLFPKEIGRIRVWYMCLLFRLIQCPKKGEFNYLFSLNLQPVVYFLIDSGSHPVWQPVVPTTNGEWCDGFLRSAKKPEN